MSFGFSTVLGGCTITEFPGRSVLEATTSTPLPKGETHREPEVLNYPNVKDTLKVMQINLNTCKAASAALSRRFTREGIAVGFIQEPWANKSRLLCFSASTGKLVYDFKSEKPKAALLFNEKIPFLPLNEFILEI